MITWNKQKTLSNAFSWTKLFEFRLQFYWSLFQSVPWTIFQHWFWPGDKPLSEPVMVSLLMHICVTRLNELTCLCNIRRVDMSNPEQNFADNIFNAFYGVQIVCISFGMYCLSFLKSSIRCNASQCRCTSTLSQSCVAMHVLFVNNGRHDIAMAVVSVEKYLQSNAIH